MLNYLIISLITLIPCTTLFSDNALISNKQTALHIIEMLKNGTLAPSYKNNPDDIDTFFDDLFISAMSRDPQELTNLGLFESIGIRGHKAYLNDLSPQNVLRTFENQKAQLATLKSYNVNNLSPDQHISHKIVLWNLQHAVDGERFLFHDYRITQLSGVLDDLMNLFTLSHKLNVREDAEHYITRLHKVTQQLNQTIALLKHQKNLGIHPPAFIIERIIAIIDDSLPTLTTDHIFYTHFAQQIKKIAGVDTNALLTRAHQAITHDVYPAYRLLRAYLVQLRSEVHTNHGVWALPNGDAYYTYMLKFHTTTDLSADEIHTIGLTHVATIHQKMRALLATHDIVAPNKNVGELMHEFSTNPRYYFPQTEQGRLACLAKFKHILERSRKELGHLFDLKPRAPVNIERVPHQKEAGSPAAYYIQPSVDGTRPGIFFVNLRNMNEVPMYGMETLTIHEAEPGHHFQLALQQEMNLPMIRTIGSNTAYIEGWALYTEKLAYENDFYSSAASELGHLQDELLRAARLVIDTGIHKKRWSREKAINYMIDVTGFHNSVVVTEVERYFALPGQACAYTIGQRKILELRKRAQDVLGDAFDIKEFHNIVLKIASTPLEVLEEVVNTYINHTRNALKDNHVHRNSIKSR